MPNTTQPPTIGNTSRKILASIAGYTLITGNPPTWAEIRQYAGITEDKQTHLMPALKRKGLLTYQPWQERTTKVTEQGLDILRNENP